MRIILYDYFPTIVASIVILDVIELIVINKDNNRVRINSIKVCICLALNSTEEASSVECPTTIET